MSDSPPFPRRIADIAVPQDDVSRATWTWATSRLPAWLLNVLGPAG